jgi:hypothetical protein
MQIKFENGDLYNGSIANYKMDGFGEMIYADSQSYVGKWKDGKYEGKGTLKNKDSCIEGEWKAGELVRTFKITHL